MNALKPLTPCHVASRPIGVPPRTPEQLRALTLDRDAGCLRDMDGPARHVRIGPAPRNWPLIISRAVIIAGLIVSTVACVTQ